MPSSYIGACSSKAAFERALSCSESGLLPLRTCALNRRGLQAQLEAGATYEQFFAPAPRLNPNRSLITGKICGVDVSAIEDPVEQNARYLDKLVDELARGRAMEKILRS